MLGGCKASDSLNGSFGGRFILGWMMTLIPQFGLKGEFWSVYSLSDDLSV